MRGTTYATRESATKTATRVGGLGFDLLFAILSTVFVAGIYLDGWAHVNTPALETFFTPWHTVLYTGFLAVAISLMTAVWLNHRQGLSWRSAIPVGYGLSVLGMFMFAIGGAGDLAWHETLGIEADVAALLSPPHLLLGTGVALTVSGPLRAAWRRTGIPSLWRTHLPMLLSLGLLLAILTFLTQYANPFATTWAAARFRPDANTAGVTEQVLTRMTRVQQALGVTGFLLQAGILMGLLLPVIRRWTLPIGGITLILTLNVALIAFMRGRLTATGPLPLIAVALLAGIAADLLCRVLRPASDATRNVRIVAFAIPALLYGLYFAALQLTGGGVWWTLPLWSGSIMLGGIAGWLLSFVLIPVGTTEGPKFR